MDDDERRRVQKERRRLVDVLDRLEDELVRRGIEAGDVDLLMEALGIVRFGCPLHPNANPDDPQSFDWNRGTGCRACARELRTPRRKRAPKLRIALDPPAEPAAQPASTSAAAPESDDGGTEATTAAAMPWQKIGL